VDGWKREDGKKGVDLQGADTNDMMREEKEGLVD